VRVAAVCVPLQQSVGRQTLSMHFVVEICRFCCRSFCQMCKQYRNCFMYTMSRSRDRTPFHSSLLVRLLSDMKHTQA